MISQPGYVSFDSKAKESFLSQIGNFTPGEREIFHRLCRSWEQEINYNRFVAAASNDSVNARTDLERLMNRLKGEGFGLISTTVRESNRVPASIILCEKHEARFYQKLVDEYLTDVIEHTDIPLPTGSYLASQGVSVPEEHLQQIPFIQFVEIAVQKPVLSDTIAEKVLFLMSDNGERILFNPTSAFRLTAAAMNKAQATLSSGNLLAAAAALLKASLIETKKNVASKIPQFWLNLSNEIVSKKRQLESHGKLTIPQGFFVLFDFIGNFIKAQVELGAKSKQAEAERKLDLQTLAETVRSADGMIMTDEAFGTAAQRFKEKYKENYDQFLKDFEAQFLTTDAKSNLPEIFHIDSKYLHSDNLHALFLSRINAVSPELQKIYINQMTQYVRRGGRIESPVFSTPQAFDDDIAEKLKTEDSLLAALLTKPQAVAEAIINSSKRSNKVRGVEDMKLVLASFFYPDQVKFKELSVIFGMDLREIYQHAFLRLSLFRQIVMRITGKHESFVRQFADHMQKLYANVAKKGGQPTIAGAEGEDADPKSRRRLAAKTMTSRRERLAAAASAKAERKAVEPPGKGTVIKQGKNYSQNEQDSAWQAFQKTLKK